jgi:hypothetical protein
MRTILSIPIYLVALLLLVVAFALGVVWMATMFGTTLCIACAEDMSDWAYDWRAALLDHMAADLDVPEAEAAP